MADDNKDAKPASKAKTSKPGDKPADKKPAAKPAAKAEPKKETAPKVNPASRPMSETFKASLPAQKTLWWIGGGIVAFLVVLVIAFGIMIYKFQSDSPVVYDAAKIIPYPAERVNGSFVSYGEFLFELRSVKQYYKSQTGQNGQPAVDFNTTDGKAKLKQLKQQLMGQLTTDEVTRQLVNKYKIKVTSKEVNDQVDQIVKASGGTDKVKEVLAKFYGWSMSDLKTKVKFQLEKQKLQDKITSDDSINAASKAKAQSVLDKVKAGGDFGELAKQYSEDSSASNGGDLGFFGKGQMVKQFEDAAFALQPGQVSGLVKTQYGYHIIKVVERNGDQVHAQHILIKTIDFDQYLQDQTKQAHTSKYLKV